MHNFNFLKELKVNLFHKNYKIIYKISLDIDSKLINLQ